MFAITWNYRHPVEPRTWTHIVVIQHKILQLYIQLKFMKQLLTDVLLRTRRYNWIFQPCHWYCRISHCFVYHLVVSTVRCLSPTYGTDGKLHWVEIEHSHIKSRAAERYGEGLSSRPAWWAFRKWEKTSDFRHWVRYFGKMLSPYQWKICPSNRFENTSIFVDR